MSCVDTSVVVDTIVVPGDRLSSGVRDDSHLQEVRMVEPSDLAEQRVRTVAAKLSLPHMGFVLSRQRLVSLLKPVANGGVVYLVAGPGYGKTALIVEKLSSAGGRTVYFSVDEADNDPLRFLTYFMAGLDVEVADRPDSRPLDWPAPGGIDQEVLELTAQVVDHIRQKAGQSTLIAIDDFHLIDSSPQIVSVLELIVRGLPPGWTILISSRRPVPLRVDRVSLGGRCVELRARDLRLTPREVGTWASQHWGIELQASEARALWRLTQGWPAALVLLGQRLPSGRRGITRSDITEVLSRGHDLRKYLEQDILSGLDETASETMLTAGLLTRVVFPRDEAFFPGPYGRAEAVLEELVLRGYLVARVGRRSYTVHPLVRGFAQRKAWRDNESTGLMDQTASHLERIGEHHQAVTVYLRVGRFSDAGRLLHSLLAQPFGMGPGSTRPEWLSLIPDESIAEDGVDPWLIVAKARIQQEHAEYARAGALYERAARLLAEDGDKEGLLCVLLGSAYCLFNQGRWEESLAVMKRCRSLAGSSREKAEVLVVEGGVLVGLCRWDEAVENWEKALVLYPKDSKDSAEEFARRIHFHRARLFYSLGHYRLARQWADKAVGLDDSPVTLVRAVALNGAALLAGLTGEYDKADRYAGECLRLVRTRGYSLVEASSLLSQAMAALGRWDYRSAVARIRRAQALALSSGDAEESYWAESMLGDLCRRTGNGRRALEHHQTALEIVEKNQLAASEKLQAQAAVGMDLVVLGRETEGLASLEETALVSRRLGLKSALAPALFYLGWLYAHAGREHEAGRALAEAMRLGEEHGHIHFFSQEAKVAAPILALCERFGVGTFVRDQIAPRLPGRLQHYLRELAGGKAYPTDMSLGSPGRRTGGVRPLGSGNGGQASPAIVARMESLTEREWEVLEMVGLGMPNKVIGARLFISEKTVKTHTNHIFRKLGVENRLQATLAFQTLQRGGVRRPGCSSSAEGS